MKQTKKNRELILIFAALLAVFLVFLVWPLAQVLWRSFLTDTGASLDNYVSVLTGKGFLTAVKNSFTVAGVSAAVTTLLAFFLAYTVHYTNIGRPYKRLIGKAAQLPMLLPTITYGFAIIYSFGKQGLLTRLFGRQLFEIYGFNGLVLGYVIYTLPVSFMLITNTMQYIDKKFLVVSRVMGDSPFRSFVTATLRPLTGTLAASLIQTFFLSFTDFGIPASVGGDYETVASVLYATMLGSVPDFGKGAVVAFVMLVPSVLSILVLHKLEKYNVRYSRTSAVEMKKSFVRDAVCALGSGAVLLSVLSVFAVIFVVPFVRDWPYYTEFSLEHFSSVFGDSELSAVYVNSIITALLTAVLGTLAAYGAALLTARSTVSQRLKGIIEGITLVTNTIPGMVLGLAFLFAFSGSPLQGTLALLVLCNMVHYFSTPYLMMKNSLEKMNASWETTAMLMGDSWTKTILRIVTPNAVSTILEVFAYYFVNAMVTISAVIFIAGARTMVITTKIKELQYYNKFNEVFVLSLLILATNLISKSVLGFMARHREGKEKKEKKIMKRKITAKAMGRAVCMGLTGILGAGMLLGASGCAGGGDDKVVIYSNADDEAVTAMKNALDENGFKDQYIFQTFGTSELGGKLLAEGKNIEADLVTMSTFYLESAQEQNQMFADLEFDAKTLDEYPSYCAPITAQEGTIILNTEVMEENSLPQPLALKDLADPVYKDMVSVTDIKSSSTAWLLIQALISAYGEDGAQEVLTQIYDNAGPHIEESGSGPLKKVRAGEVAIGFGLRQQAVADKEEGLPIDFVDPEEGTFSLTESAAVVDKGDKTNEKAAQMQQCIIENARAELIQHYPLALYEGESTDSADKSANQKVFEEKLTVDLLKKHQELSEECK